MAASSVTEDSSVASVGDGCSSGNATGEQETENLDGAEETLS